MSHHFYMAAPSQAEADAQLSLWMAASRAVSVGQSYSIAGRSLTRSNAAEIREMITYWQNMSDGFAAAALGATRSNVLIATKTR